MIKSLEEINLESWKHGIFLSISGPLSQDLMVEMGEILKRKMEAEGAGSTVIHQVFSILVELNQNIIHYSAEKLQRGDNKDGETSGCGIMSVGYKDGCYILMAGNLVENRKIEGMKSKLAQIMGMNKDQLNHLYREQRKGFPDEDSKGAGLGLIEVARKVSQPMEYQFEDVDEEFSFFTLKAVI
jgi:hypothetical protein